MVHGSLSKVEISLFKIHDFTLSKTQPNHQQQQKLDRIPLDDEECHFFVCLRQIIMFLLIPDYSIDSKKEENS
ncbi:hypothetical protein DERP_009467 [Dermatophagoides pteronyssinus]|uniref:Uncharacterized protein n=1 Tax=Dermatophagoides pteronyssinus TaxID=6956 RepID=A0ABQ8IU70_DERPT|nr:hypothetical protein DERP_009467 [Dermatophagoides pteronyssinus]